MTRDNSGHYSGQTRDTRDINLVPTRDGRDKPPRRGCPCPGKDGNRSNRNLWYGGTEQPRFANQSVGLAELRTGKEGTRALRALAAIACLFLLAPQSFEPVRVERRITHGVGDLAVTEVALQGSGIHAFVDQGVARSVTQGVRVDLKSAHAGIVGQSGEQLSKSAGGHRSAALGDEHEFLFGVVSAELAQGSKLIPLERVYAADRSLEPVYVQPGRVEVHVRPSDVYQLADPQRMAEGEQYHGRVALTTAPALIPAGCSYQLSDFPLGQMFSRANRGIGLSLRRNCPIFSAWAVSSDHRKYLTHLNLHLVTVPTITINGTDYTDLFSTQEASESA